MAYRVHGFALPVPPDGSVMLQTYACYTIGGHEALYHPYSNMKSTVDILSAFEVKIASLSIARHCRSCTRDFNRWLYLWRVSIQRLRCSVAPLHRLVPSVLPVDPTGAHINHLRRSRSAKPVHRSSATPRDRGRNAPLRGIPSPAESPYRRRLSHILSAAPAAPLQDVESQLFRTKSSAAGSRSASLGDGRYSTTEETQSRGQSKQVPSARCRGHQLPYHQPRQLEVASARWTCRSLRFHSTPRPLTVCPY